MAKLVVLYGMPVDANEFDRHYRETHAPLVHAMPGLRSLEISSGPVTTRPGGIPRHCVAMLTFDSFDALAAALASPQGQAAAADVANFASGGAEIMYFDTQDV
jgi:uncharacterized protein (TIGR02118 family)